MGTEADAVMMECSPAEVRMVADELGQAYARSVRTYAAHMKMTLTEAEAKAAEPPAAEYLALLLDSPPAEMTWSGLQDLTQHDPALALQAWEGVKGAAWEEFESGTAAAKVMEWRMGEPKDRARFLVVRRALRLEWKPQGGMEDLLIDMMTQCYLVYEHWLGQLMVQSLAEGSRNERQTQETGKWVTPHIQVYEAMEQAAGMVDRFNRLFLRTLRALRDLRRYEVPGVRIENAGQVNVGGQQVNVAREG